MIVSQSSCRVVLNFLMYRSIRRLSYFVKTLGRPHLHFVAAVLRVLMSPTVLFGIPVSSLISQIVCLLPSTRARTRLHFFELQSHCFLGLPMPLWRPVGRFRSGGSTKVLLQGSKSRVGSALIGLHNLCPETFWWTCSLSVGSCTFSLNIKAIWFRRYVTPYRA